jgi:hypothetical protein
MRHVMHQHDRLLAAGPVYGAAAARLVYGRTVV